MDEVKGSTLTRTFASVEQVFLKDFSPPNFHPKQTSPNLKAHLFHAECCHNVIVHHNVLQAFGTQLYIKECFLVCDGVSIAMHKFPDYASEATPIQHLLQDCLERNEENHKDGLSW